MLLIFCDLICSYTIDSMFENGTYVVAYNITVASAYTINVTINDEPIYNPVALITLHPAPIFADKCYVYGDMSDPGVAGALRTFYIQLTDVYFNNITNITDPISAVDVQVANSPVPFTITPVYYGDGRYACSYNATAMGTYDFVVLVGGQNISNGTFSFFLDPSAPYPAYCIAEGQALTQAAAGANASFAIYLFDSFNNSILTDVLAPTVLMDTTVMQFYHFIFCPLIYFLQPLTAVFTGGYYTVYYNVTTTGNYVIYVTIGSVPISTPPSTLVVSPAPLAVFNCLISGAGLSGTRTVFFFIMCLQLFSWNSGSRGGLRCSTERRLW